MYRLQDLMKMFDIPERTIRRHLKQEILKGVKVGGAWRFSEGDIQEYLNRSDIRDTLTKNAIRQVMDYMYGISPLNDKILISKNVKKINQRDKQKITEFMASIGKEFRLHINHQGIYDNIVYIGDYASVQKVLDFLGDYDEYII